MTRRSREIGESFEAALDAMHADYARRGVAWVRRVGTPVKVMGVVRRDGRGRSRFAAAFDGPQGADFVGFTAAGRHVCLEAKAHTMRSAWPSGVRSDGTVGTGALGEAQWLELRAAESAGCVALVILRAWGECYAFTPVDLVAHAAREGRSTIRPEDSALVGKRIGPEFRPDWMGR